AACGDDNDDGKNNLSGTAWISDSTVDGNFLLQLKEERGFILTISQGDFGYGTTNQLRIDGSWTFSGKTVTLTAEQFIDGSRTLSLSGNILTFNDNEDVKLINVFSAFDGTWKPEDTANYIKYVFTKESFTKGAFIGYSKDMAITRGTFSGLSFWDTSLNMTMVALLQYNIPVIEWINAGENGTKPADKWEKKPDYLTGFQLNMISRNKINIGSVYLDGQDLGFSGILNMPGGVFIRQNQ
ncbi:hypothetical protein, partial [Treponema sp. R80B11-R83G3]